MYWRNHYTGIIAEICILLCYSVLPKRQRYNQAKSCSWTCAVMPANTATTVRVTAINVTID